jgi:Fe-S-cluster containining protein
MSSTLVNAVRSASEREDVVSAVAAVYGDVQLAINEQRPICEMSGRCCKFEEYGHRLYVSTLELAAFVAGREANEERGTMNDERKAGSLLVVPSSPAAGDCPFQIGKLCSVHAIRPFGCRMFFCDSTATDWQQAMYEQFHARLKSMHDELGVDYFYVEWRAALKELDLQ